MLEVAHRGDTAKLPENTLKSIQVAGETGITHFEFDAQY